VSVDCFVVSLIAMTDTRPRSRGAERARVVHKPSPKEGVGNAGCPVHPQPRVRMVVVNAHEYSQRVHRNRPAFPHAMVLTVSSALSPGTGLSCPRRPLRSLLPRNLMPASGHQDHTASPSASAPLVLRRCRVHRIQPRVRDDRDTPLCGVDGGINKAVSSNRRSEIFFTEGLDTKITKTARRANQPTTPP
jgi:hypothetical protein